MWFVVLIYIADDIRDTSKLADSRNSVMANQPMAWMWSIRTCIHAYMHTYRVWQASCTPLSSNVAHTRDDELWKENQS